MTGFLSSGVPFSVLSTAESAELTSQPQGNWIVRQETKSMLVKCTALENLESDCT